MAGDGVGHGEVGAKNETDTREVARRLGLKEAIFLNYPNHNLDAWPIVEMRARLVFLFRYFKVDTVVVYDPSGLYERNPDHYVTARAVEWAAGICAMKWDYPEFGLAGVKPHAGERTILLLPRAATRESSGRYQRLHRSESLGQPGKCDARPFAEILAMSCARDWPRKGSDCPCWATMRIRQTGNTPSTSLWPRPRTRSGAQPGCGPSTSTTSGRTDRNGTSTSRRTPFRCSVTRLSTSGVPLYDRLCACHRAWPYSPRSTVPEILSPLTSPRKVYGKGVPSAGSELRSSTRLPSITPLTLPW